MHSHPSLPEGEAKTGPAKSAGRDLRRLAAVAVLGAGLLALGVADRSVPAVAQLKAGVPAETLSFANIVEQVKPAVVSISTTNDVPKVADSTPRRRGKQSSPFEGLPGLPEDHPLNELFKNLPNGAPQPQRPRQAAGSGFVVSSDGYIVTNRHVIDGATKVKVSFDDQEEIDATIVGTDERTDIALLKIEPKRPPDGRQVRGQDPARRRLGAGGRQSVRPRRHCDGRHRVGARPQHRRPLRLHADRRRGEPRQLRRSGLQSRGPRRRREHGDLQPDRRQRRHRFRRAGRHRDGGSWSSSRRVAASAAAGLA